jgi:hypothetical protein
MRFDELAFYKEQAILLSRKPLAIYFAPRGCGEKITVAVGAGTAQM